MEAKGKKGGQKGAAADGKRGGKDGKVGRGRARVLRGCGMQRERVLCVGLWRTQPRVLRRSLPALHAHPAPLPGPAGARAAARGLAGVLHRVRLLPRVRRGKHQGPRAAEETGRGGREEEVAAVRVATPLARSRRGQTERAGCHDAQRCASDDSSGLPRINGSQSLHKCTLTRIQAQLDLGRPPKPWGYPVPCFNYGITLRHPLVLLKILISNSSASSICTESVTYRGVAAMRGGGCACSAATAIGWNMGLDFATLERPPKPQPVTCNYRGAPGIFGQFSRL